MSEIKFKKKDYPFGVEEGTRQERERVFDLLVKYRTGHMTLDELARKIKNDRKR